MNNTDRDSNSNSRKLPYGSWPSPVSAELVAGKSLRLGQPLLVDDAAYWLETRPDEGGRTTLVRRTVDGQEDLLPAPFSVQSKVHGYGGGAYAVHRETAWFVNKHDQCIYRLENGAAKQLTDSETLAFADLVHDPHRDRLLAVCEDHDPALAQVRTTLVAINCQDGTVTTLLEGSDFYSSPRLSPDGRRLAWLEWQHPDMPWDATQLKVSELDAAGLPGDAREVAGGDDESVLQPMWRDNEELLFVSDRSNWWNLYAWSDGAERCLHAMEAEFAQPHWIFGMANFALRTPDRLVCAYGREGGWRLAELDLQSGAWREHGLAYTQMEHVHASNGKVILHASNALEPAAIVLLDDSDQTEVLRKAAEVDLDAAFLEPPEAVRFTTDDNEQAYALYYAPSNADYTGPDDELPPLLVKVHGGPTSATSSALDMKIRFWTSRGFAVLDVNYRGSTGYGRKYRQSLYGRWGVADVADAINGARAMAKQGKADPQRLLISGSSAGGFTVLAALVFHDVFAAGASYYGVADPATVMRDTEKFESRYGDKLIGPLPETEDIWRQRSPLHHADRLERPVLFLQGLEDRIVPPDQSERMFEAARANGVDTFYIAFPGEGHGFRGGETIATALRAEYAFYCRTFGIEPAESLPELENIATRGGASN